MKVKLNVPDYKNKNLWVNRFDISKFLNVSYGVIKNVIEEKDFPRPIIWANKTIWRKEEVESWVVRNWINGAK